MSREESFVEARIDGEAEEETLVKRLKDYQAKIDYYSSLTFDKLVEGVFDEKPSIRSGVERILVSKVWKKVTFRHCFMEDILPIVCIALKGNCIESLHFSYDEEDYVDSMIEQELGNDFSSALSKTSALQELNFEEIMIMEASAESLREGIKNCSHLKVLNLAFHDFENESAGETFSEGLFHENASIEKLALATENASGNEPICRMLESLGTSKQALSRLFVCTATAPALEIAADRVAELLDREVLSGSLSLCWNESDDDILSRNRTNMEPLLRAVAVSQTLKSLSIRTGFTSEVMRHISEAFVVNKVLDKFECIGPPTKEGIQTFLDALPRFNVKQMRLFDGSGVCVAELKGQFIKALEMNYELETLEIFTLSEFDEGTAIRHLCRLNRGGRRLLRSNTPAPRGLWPLVLARANKLTFPDYEDEAARAEIIYELLHGPVLTDRDNRKRKTMDD